jgi:hypothetical protein
VVDTTQVLNQMILPRINLALGTQMDAMIFKVIHCGIIKTTVGTTASPCDGRYLDVAEWCASPPVDIEM